MKPTLRILVVVTGLLLAACSALDRGVPAGSAPASTGNGQVTETVSPAAPDPAFDRLFTRFGGGWTGGDGTYSIGLPDGRTLWMFGDTFLGRVNPDRTRPADSPLINNCFVIQDRESLKTLYGGSADSPLALMTPTDGVGWYWPADGTVEGDVVRVFFRRFRRTGPDPWQYAWVGTDLAGFSLPNLANATLSPLKFSSEVMYGSSILEAEGMTYIFGTEDLGERKYAHVARAAAGQLTGQWEFYTGSGWSTDARLSARILDGVANQFSVLEVRGRFLLLTVDTHTPFSNLLVAYLSHRPWGPWQGPVAVYTPPEAVGDVVAYNAFAHPEFTHGDRLLVSYNLNAVSDFNIPYRDADAYRPRFIRVDLKRLLAAFER